MSILLSNLGLSAIFGGLLLAARPGLILSMLSTFGDSFGLYLTAVGARVVLGSLLAYYGSLSSYPVFVTALGWVTLAAAVALILLRHRGFKRMMHWSLGALYRYARIVSPLTIVLGAFLFHIGWSTSFCIP